MRRVSKKGDIDVRFVSVEGGITALGFRKMASIARELNPKTRIYFIAVNNLYSFLSHFLPSAKDALDSRDIKIVAEELAEADLVAFSSMSASARYVELITTEIRKRNPKAFILWGGVHCVVYPDEAIKHVDAICTGEGEKAFRNFYLSFSSGKDYLGTKGMWFNHKGKIIKNTNESLNSPDEMERYPHLFMDNSCCIYDCSRSRFKKFDEMSYANFHGLTYRTVWSLGCPYNCIYCANNSFISIDKGYANVRFPSVEYIIGEIERAIKIHPSICTVAFYDDNFIAIPVDTLKKFAAEYQRRVNLPFVVFGIHPNTITEEKIEILARAGMNRARMGIQSGSTKTLAFFNRPTSTKRISEAARILAEAAQKYKMIPPSYDIISDNPVEGRKEIIETLEFLYNLKRPFTLTVFSLRVFPKTKLWEYFRGHPEIDITSNISSYLETKKVMANIIIYLLAFCRPPRWLFDTLLRRVRATKDAQQEYPLMYLLVRAAYFLSRAVEHIARLDFSVMVGSWTYYLWRLGLVRSGKGRRQ